MRLFLPFPGGLLPRKTIRTLCKYGGLVGWIDHIEGYYEASLSCCRVAVPFRARASDKMEPKGSHLEIG